MRDMELIDKILYLVFVLCGAFIMFVIPFGFYKFACIDFEILVYKKIVEATITIALLTAIPVVATLVYMFKYETLRNKMDKIEWHYMIHHYEDYKRYERLFK